MNSAGVMVSATPRSVVDGKNAPAHIREVEELLLHREKDPVRLQKVGTEDHVVSHVVLPPDPRLDVGILSRTAPEVAHQQLGVADTFAPDDDLAERRDPGVDLPRPDTADAAFRGNLAGFARHAQAAR